MLSFSEQLMPTVKTPNDEPALEQAAQELAEVLDAEFPEIIISTAAEGVFEWFGEVLVDDKQQFPRVTDMARRFAFVLAVCNGASEIDDETAKLAMDFGCYQLEAYKRLMPDDASNPIQAFENRIIRFFEKHGPATQRDARNNIKPEYSPGGYLAFRRAFDSLVRTEKLKMHGSNRVGKELWKVDA